MNEFGPGPEETGAQDWQEPTTDDQEQEVTPTFLESAEMTEIRTRIEGGEELTPELCISFQITGEQVVDATSPENRFASQIELTLATAELKIKAGLAEYALDDLNQALEIATAAGLDSYIERAQAKIAELESSQPNS